MCQTIYITTLGAEILQERTCVNAGHPEHSEVFINGEWREKP